MSLLPILVLFILAPSLPATLAVNFLVSPASLYSGQKLEYGYYRLVMQEDCNLVLYDGGSAIWSSKTNNKGNNCRVAMQSDGNLVVYSGSSKALWASRTKGVSGTYRCILQADRNVVVYGPDSGGAYGPPRWSTRSNVNSIAVNLQGRSVAESSNNTLT